MVTCQSGADAALKAEMARRWPELKPGFTRPGFATFRLPETHQPGRELNLRCAFPRFAAFTLASISADTPAEAAAQLWRSVADVPAQQLHVFSRDGASPAEREFHPGVGPGLEEAEAALIAAAPAERKVQVNRLVKPDKLILDCVLVKPLQWWIGYHWGTSPPARWPGGVPHYRLPENAVSRAYLKMREAIAWSRFPMDAGDRCAELGSAPGGGTQALLGRGLHVMGIDPAQMDPVVLAHPRFQHIRKRGDDLKRREYRGIRWLTADINVVPEEALRVVQSIVTHQDVSIRGLILMLKLRDWNLADKLPDYIQRVKDWGYRHVRARQLAYNRREVCLAAIKHRSLRRIDTRRRSRPEAPRPSEH